MKRDQEVIYAMGIVGAYTYSPIVENRTVRVLTSTCAWPAAGSWTD